MWPALAPDDALTCAECRHRIPAGRPMLSELPNPAPPSMDYQDFAAYCLGCPQCQSQGKHACYVRRLERQPVLAATPRSLPCARCGLRLPAHEKAPAQVYYEWPTATEAGLNRPLPKVTKFAGIAGTGGVSAGAADALTNPIPGFADLPAELQRAFLTRGMRNGMERPIHEAQLAYQNMIPDSVKVQGPDAIAKAIDSSKYDFSHRLSAHNHPDQAASGLNVRLEDRGLNRAQQEADMTQQQWDSLPHQNFVDSNAVVAQECLNAGLRSGFYAALLEAPVTAIENYLLVKRGRRTEEEALRAAAQDIKARAVQGAIAGCGIKLFVMAGGGAILAPLSPILIPVGLALYGHQAIKRIMRANAAGAPLHLTGTWFCSPRCQQKMAWETGWSTLLQWQENRQITSRKQLGAAHA